MTSEPYDPRDQLKATKDLTTEVHALGDRLTAKENLHKRTRTLTLVNLGIVGLLVVVAIIAGIAFVRLNGFLTCFGEWSAASSVRQRVLNDAAEKVAYRTGVRDAALGVLVDYRGEANSETTDRAKTDYREADRRKLEAELELKILRDEYPAPQIWDYCTNVEKVEPKDPKV